MTSLFHLNQGKEENSGFQLNDYTRICLITEASTKKQHNSILRVSHFEELILLTKQLYPQNITTFKAQLNKVHVESKIMTNLTLVKFLLNFKHQILTEISSGVMLFLRCKPHVILLFNKML